MYELDINGRLGGAYDKSALTYQIDLHLVLVASIRVHEYNRRKVIIQRICFECLLTHSARYYRKMIDVLESDSAKPSISSVARKSASITRSDERRCSFRCAAATRTAVCARPHTAQPLWILCHPRLFLRAIHVVVKLTNGLICH